MKIIQVGVTPRPPWQKRIICTHTREKGRVVCGAIFEIESQDLKEEVFGNQDERAEEYTYHVLCPTCSTKIHVPERDTIKRWN